ncbi:MAG: hypothetical protein ACRESC_03675, partial [Gammaproteobacteria bacterium]
THEYASWTNGVLNLGYRGDVSEDDIRENFRKILNDPGLRTEMRNHSSKLDLSKGKQRVIKSLVALLDSK